MKKCIIFDLDQTLVDTSIAESYRDNRSWSKAVLLISNFTLYKGLSEVFDYIRKNGIMVAIVSNSVSYYVDKVISYFNIPCDLRIAYHDVGRHKPDSECMIRVLNDLKLKPSDVISIGDSDIDIIASRNAGIFSIGCLWGNVSGFASSPDATINDPREIIEYLQ